MTASRLRAFGTTIFAEMTALATRTGAINLGQGYPDIDGPAEIIAAVEAAMRGGSANQYAPLHGVPELCVAIAEHQRRRYGLEIDPEAGRTLVRLAFCKRPEVIDEALVRLTAAAAAID